LKRKADSVTPDSPEHDGQSNYASIARYMQLPVRLSVTRADLSKAVKLMIIQFSPYIPISLWG